MTTLTKCICGGIVLIALIAIFYPEKASKVKETLETTGAVAMDKTLSSMVKWVGEADVAIERYKQAKENKKSALIALKTTKKNTEDKVTEAAIAAAEYRQEGKEAEALKKDAEKKTYEEQVATLDEKVKKAEEEYKKFCSKVDKKIEEIRILKTRAELLKNELAAGSGDAESEALRKAKEAEDALKSECNRIEAEIEVMSLEN